MIKKSGSRARLHSTKERYTESQGNHHPRFGGRCLIASIPADQNLLWVSNLLIILPVIGCFVFVNHTYEFPWFIICDIILGILSIICISNLYIASFTEPGILKTEQNSLTMIYSVITPDGTKHELKEFRAKFCRETNNCIENFDHYCPWVSNGIGIRNYSFFIVFLIHIFLIDIFTFIVSMVSLFTKMNGNHWTDFVDALSDRIACVVLIFYSIVVAFTIFPLFFYHIGLICRNQTTNEDLKRVYWLRTENPNDKGNFRNCLNFWKSFGKRRDSLIFQYASNHQHQQQQQQHDNNDNKNTEMEKHI